MIRVRVKYLLLLGSSCAVMLQSEAAQAQAGPALPPIRTVVDERGVDLTSGEAIAGMPPLEAGAGETRLSHQARWSPEAGAWVHNYIMPFVETATTVSIAPNGTTIRFDKVGSTFVARDGGSETLTFSSPYWTLTLSDGTVLRFEKRNYSDQVEVLPVQVDAAIVQIIYPDGESIAINHERLEHYPFWPDGEADLYERVISATSNLGYMLKYNYELEQPWVANGDGVEFPERKWGVLKKVQTMNLNDSTCNSWQSGECLNTPSLEARTYSATTIVQGSETTLTLTSTDMAGNTSVAESRFVDITPNNGFADGKFYLSRTKSPVAASFDTSFLYDAQGRVSQYQGVLGTSSYSWSVNGSLVTASIADAVGPVRTVVTDSGLRVVKSDTDGLGRSWTYTHDSTGRVVGATSPLGQQYQYTYDARGNLTTTSLLPTGGGAAITLQLLAFPAICSNPLTCNKPTSSTDSRGNVTNYQYDPVHGGVTSIMEPAVGGIRPTTAISYSTFSATYLNASGALANSTPVYRPTTTSFCRTAQYCNGTENEVRSTVAYENVGSGVRSNVRPVSRTVASGNGSLSATTTSAYDIKGNVLSVDGPAAGNADVTRYRYDVDRRVVGVIGPDPDGSGPLPHGAQRITYDSRGLVVLVEDGKVNGTSDTDWNAFTAFSQARSSFDSQGRKVADSVEAGGTVFALANYSYDSRSRPECTAVRMNPAQFGTVVGACSQGIAGSNGLDRITRQVYDAANQLVKSQQAVGTPIQIDATTATYTATGEVATLTDANGNRTTYEYDAYDRPIKALFPSKDVTGTSSPSDFEQVTYDAGGNILTRRKRDATVLTFEYDALNRITRKTVPERSGLAAIHTRDVFYTYDLAGTPLGVRFDNATTGAGLTASYDGLGRLIQADDNTTGTNRAISFQYDIVGNRTRLTYPDGQYVGYDYDVLGRITGLRENGTLLGSTTFNERGQNTQLSWSNQTATANARNYTHDQVGRLAAIGLNLDGTAADVTWNYAHNPASQIVSETQSNDSYSWDGHVNLTRSYASNGLNQYVSAGSANFCYDGNGNLTADGGSVYLYDAENRLVEKRAQGTGNTNCAALYYGGALQAQLLYDPTGRLYEVSSGGTWAPSRFAYDGNAIIAEYKLSGLMLRRYVHGSNAEADDPLIWYEYDTPTSMLRRYLHSDPRGSIVAVTDHTGNRIAVNSYDEYGIPDTATGNDIATKGRFRYTGQAWIPELGMYYYKARVYSPTLGRFLQPDPIGYGDGMNIYAYVRSDPINNVDPTGLTCRDTGGVASSGFRDYDGDLLPGTFCDPANPEEDNPGYAVNGRRPGPLKRFSLFANPLDNLLDFHNQFPYNYTGREASRAQSVRTYPPRCTATQTLAQSYGLAVAKVGAYATKTGDGLTLGGGAIAAVSAATLNPAGVLIGGEIVVAGGTIGTAGRIATVIGGVTALAGGASVRQVGSQIIVDSAPLNFLYRDAAERFVDRSMDSLNVPNNVKCKI